jgi:hypothetical protein
VSLLDEAIVLVHTAEIQSSLSKNNNCLGPMLPLGAENTDFGVYSSICFGGGFGFAVLKRLVNLIPGLLCPEEALGLCAWQMAKLPPVLCLVIMTPRPWCQAAGD